MKNMLFGLIAVFALTIAIAVGLYFTKSKVTPETPNNEIVETKNPEVEKVVPEKNVRDKSATSKQSDQPSLDEILQTVKLNKTEDDKASYDASLKTETRKIYTMDTLPQDKSGIYWVKDSDGNVNQIAVDKPGEDSPIGEF